MKTRKLLAQRPYESVWMESTAVKLAKRSEKEYMWGYWERIPLAQEGEWAEKMEEDP